MAKIYGLFGSMTGKVADVVMAVRNGEQIARKYQPVVSNPNSPAQVATRAKLKLLSQLSAVLAPSIAIPREGVVSSRNLFLKSNYGLASYANNEASVDLQNVQITRSVVGLPSLYAGRVQGTGIEVGLNASAGYESFARVVYVALAKQADKTLRFAGSVVSSDSTNGLFKATFPEIPEEVVFLAYGVRDNSEAARVVFGNMEVPTAERIAKIVTSRSLTELDVTLTETKGIVLQAVNPPSPGE